MSRGFGDLIVWQRAKDLAKHVYTATEGLPKSEMFGLTSQMRRTAVSVAPHIAEGQAQLAKGEGECRQFLGRSRGSLLELETQLELAVEMGYVSIEDFRKLEPEMAEVRRLLNALIESRDVWRTAEAS